MPSLIDRSGSIPFYGQVSWANFIDWLVTNYSKSNNITYTTFPLFQWYAQTGSGYNTYIRVAEFNPSIHNSIEDALEDQRVLPFSSSEEWFLISNENSYQYPYSGAGTLLEGKVYGWQIKVEIPTTSGPEDMLSSAYAFKIGTSGTIETANTINNPLLITLEEALGADQFNALFGDEANKFNLIL